MKGGANKMIKLTKKTLGWSDVVDVAARLTNEVSPELLHRVRTEGLFLYCTDSCPRWVQTYSKEEGVQEVKDGSGMGVGRGPGFTYNLVQEENWRGAIFQSSSQSGIVRFRRTAQGEYAIEAYLLTEGDQMVSRYSELFSEWDSEEETPWTDKLIQDLFRVY